MVQHAIGYVGLIALHSQQSLAERNQEEVDVAILSWGAHVYFHGRARDVDHQPITLMYVNVCRGFLWPTRANFRLSGCMHAIVRALVSHRTAHTAFRLTSETLCDFAGYSHDMLIAAMSTGLWRLFATKCYETLTFAGPHTHEDALPCLVQPVTCVMSFLCTADLRDVCWRLDWPSNYF